jgi:hypothetical protein
MVVLYGRRVHNGRERRLPGRADDGSAAGSLAFATQLDPAYHKARVVRRRMVTKAGRAAASPGLP